MRPETEIRFWQLLLAAELPFAKHDDVKQIVSRCQTEDEAIAQLRSYDRLTEAERRRLSAAPDSNRAERFQAEVVSADSMHEFVRHALPNLLGLWVSGDKSILQTPCVAIVGTRGATTYGKACAMKFSESLARGGATIVSGGAFGIDAAAHRGAIDSHGRTIAVMPCGLDIAYPASHTTLFQDVRKSGLQVSPFALGMKARSDTFLSRNYVIAALSQAVLIIEAPEASGALHTANRAADMGKQVFVVPASITHTTFRGSHALIRSGATLVDHPDQILDELGLTRTDSPQATFAGTEIQSRILALLSSEPVAPEVLADRAGLDPSEALSELTMLELDGKVIRSFGGFVLCP